MIGGENSRNRGRSRRAGLESSEARIERSLSFVCVVTVVEHRFMRRNVHNRRNGFRNGDARPPVNASLGDIVQ